VSHYLHKKLIVYMKKNLLQKGFTLIELLVVIAIIGILAAVVLSSLNDARDGGQDASIKQSIGNLRAQAELVYNQNGFDYTGVCTSGPVTRLLEAAMENRAETTSVVPTLATAAGAQVVTCHSNASGYAAIAPLNIQVGTAVQYWCVDSTGFAGTTTIASVGASDVTCQ
jgi:prepilin-type N-terminal cleavage/methylation domain-containing protein